ncbi:PilW family protein [Variovorax sp. LT1R16]|uniref:PilW family protein n=1 Tax=Variovorax sp. LT1R16 TaxID=3443728 RepID=UPI003F44A9B1
MTMWPKVSEPRPAGHHRPARGVTLIELMVALAIGLIVVLAAGTAFLAARKLFDANADIQQVQDTMRYARYVVQNVVRQAGYADYAPDRAVEGIGVVAANTALPGDAADHLSSLHVFGATRTIVPSTGDSVGVDGTDPVGANDSLLVRFFGRSAFDSDEPDSTMVDCLGQAVSGPGGAAPEAARAWSFFYVARAADGEPELYCKRRVVHPGAADSFQSQPIARGVERFKVVFGYDADGDSVPERWLDAEALDEQARAANVPASTEWRKVVGLRIGMVVRSARPNADLRHAGTALAAMTPLGAAFERRVSFDPPDDGRFRLTTTFTLMLRNAVKDPS